MTMLGLVVAYGTLLLTGAGIAFMLLARAARINVVECACLAWLFGVGTVSLLLWVCGNLLSGILLQYLVTAVCVILGFTGWRAFRRSGARLYVPRPANPFEWILIGVLAAQVAAIFYVSCKHTLGWDGLLVWEIKARYAFLSDGVLPAAYFKGNSGRAFSHPDYPLALPFTQLWIYLWTGQANQFWAKTIFPVFYIVGAGLLALLGRRVTGRRSLGYGLAILAYFVPQVTIAAGSTMVGYADLPLSIFYLATVGYLLCSLIEQPTYAFSVFATCLAFLPWIKHEGAIMWLIAAVAGVAVTLAQRKSWARLPALCPGLLLMLSWRVFLHAKGATRSVDLSTPSLETLRANLGRLGPIYHVLLREITTVNHWGNFWLLSGTAWAYLLWRWRSLPSLVLLGTTLLPIFFYSVIYVFSAWPQYWEHVGNSIPRLLMQVIPVAWLSIGAAFAERTSILSQPHPLVTRRANSSQDR